MSVPVEGGPQFLEPRLGPQTHWQNQPLAKKGRDVCVYTSLHASAIWGS